MIALDTNVIVRFLVRDDERQAQVVYDRFRKAESAREVLYVPLLIIIETLWVLESVYGKSRDDILDALDALRNMPILEFEKPPVLQNLLFEGPKTKVDLADLLIALTAKSCGCDGAITFDKKASKYPFFQLL